MQLTKNELEDELYQEYLTKVYSTTQGYQRYTPLEHQSLSREKVCVTYGELLYPSVKKILRYLQLREEDVFLDLGAGLGKCALQVFMQTPVKKVIGIEAAKPLHDQALLVMEQVKTDYSFYWDANRALVLKWGNFLTMDWEETNSVYTCSTCFTQELLIAIGNKINQIPDIHRVMSLRPLPTLALPLKKVFNVECSWDSALCFYYHR